MSLAPEIFKAAGLTNRETRVSLARKAAWSSGIVAIIALLLMIGLPLIASTQIVRDGIANQMSAWSGYRVRLDDSPDIQVWPTFRAVLNDVTLLDWNTRDPQPRARGEPG